MTWYVWYGMMEYRTTFVNCVTLYYSAIQHSSAYTKQSKIHTDIRIGKTNNETKIYITYTRNRWHNSFWEKCNQWTKTDSLCKSSATLKMTRVWCNSQYSIFSFTCHRLSFMEPLTKERVEVEQNSMIFELTLSQFHWLVNLSGSSQHHHVVDLGNNKS